MAPTAVRHYIHGDLTETGTIYCSRCDAFETPAEFDACALAKPDVLLKMSRGGHLTRIPWTPMDRCMADLKSWQRAKARPRERSALRFLDRPADAPNVLLQRSHQNAEVTAEVTPNPKQIKDFKR